MEHSRRIPCWLVTDSWPGLNSPEAHETQVPEGQTLGRSKLVLIGGTLARRPPSKGALPCQETRSHRVKEGSDREGNSK